MTEPVEAGLNDDLVANLERERLGARLLGRRRVTADGCWIWTGSLDHKGYGYIKIGSRTDHSQRNVKVHRIAYTIWVGPIGSGLQIDHICRVRACFKPGHLRQATNKQNQENKPARVPGSVSGFRGVIWDRKRRAWRVRVLHNGRWINGGWFSDVDQAAQAAARLRCELYTHNVADRSA